MASSVYTTFNTKQTQQTSFIPGQEHKQAVNNAGGVSYKLDKWGAFNRFLILGSEGGTYYTNEKKLTKDNALNVIACIAEDGERAVKEIIRISDEGLAPKNDPAIFALALAASAQDIKTRQFAFDNLSKVCRIPTHLFHFLEYSKGMRGWGSGLKKAIQNWYLEKPIDQLAYQMVKFQQRDGWANSDALRKAHPKTAEAGRNLLFRWAVDGFEGMTKLAQEKYELASLSPEIITGFELAKTADTKELVQLISQYNLSREMLPTESLTKPEIWEALLDKMPFTAMLRNLGNMSKVGLLKPLSQAEKLVISKLQDEVSLRKARIHPISVLLAMKTYASGAGLKGSGTWNVCPKVVDTLDDTFYAAFKFAEPAGKNFLVGVDVSGSMSWYNAAGLPITPAEGAAAMALSIAKIEPNTYIHGFCHTFVDLGITPKMRLDAALQRTSSLNFGRTDCSLPAMHALKENLNIDCIVIITDNETYAGKPHPSQALAQLRNKLGKPVKQVVIGMTATNFTIADPDDALSLDVAGFSADVPQLVTQFAS